MQVRMQAVRILGARRNLPTAISALQSLGTFHVDAKAVAAAESAPLWTALDPASDEAQDAAALTSRTAVVQSLIETLGSAWEASGRPSGTETAGPGPNDAEWLQTVQQAVATTVHARDQAVEALATLPRYREILTLLAPLAPRLPALRNYEVIPLILEGDASSSISLLENEVRRLTEDRYILLSGRAAGGATAALLVVPRRLLASVHELLFEANIVEVLLPGELAGRSFAAGLDYIAGRIEELPRQIDSLTRDLGLLAARWLPQLRLESDELARRVERLEVLPDVGASKYTFAISGWVPARGRSRLEHELVQATAGEVEVQDLPNRLAQSEPPVLVETHPFFRPFRRLMDLLPSPVYGTIDPTPLMGILFPVFFGLIVADIGYGAIFLVIAWVLRRRYGDRKWLCDFSQILIYSSVMTIVFGIVFGELLGPLGRRVGLEPLWLDRGEAVMPVFMLAIGLGAAHITLGFVLGLANGVLLRNRHVIIEKAAQLGTVMGLFLVLAVILDWLPGQLLTPAIGAVLVSQALMLRTAGLFGAVESLQLFSNVLSYLRIPAIGLSSVYIAVVANELASKAGNIFVGIALAILIHTLNVALGLFTPSIQSLRLHYVEFFSKFYVTGGRPYRPFGLTGSAASAGRR